MGTVGAGGKTVGKAVGRLDAKRALALKSGRSKVSGGIASEAVTTQGSRAEGEGVVGKIPIGSDVLVEMARK